MEDSAVHLTSFQVSAYHLEEVQDAEHRVALAAYLMAVVSTSVERQVVHVEEDHVEEVHVEEDHAEEDHVVEDHVEVHAAEDHVAEDHVEEDLVVEDLVEEVHEVVAHPFAEDRYAACALDGLEEAHALAVAVVVANLVLVVVVEVHGVASS